MVAMLELNQSTLERLGLEGLDPAAKRRILARFYSSLELLVGTRLTRDLSQSQLSELELLMDRDEDSESLRWLEINRPDYKETVSRSMDDLFEVVAESVEDFKRSKWNALT